MYVFPQHPQSSKFFSKKKGCKIPGLAIFSSTDEQDQVQEQLLPRGPNKKRK